jgi:hypothetical protein
MGTVGLEYCAPLDVCILRVAGDVTVPEIAAIMAAAAVEHPRSRNLWDLSEAAFDAWGTDRVAELVGHLGQVAPRDPGRRVALVVASSTGSRICRQVRDHVTGAGLPLHLSVFATRPPALEWLGVMRLPIGA